MNAVQGRILIADDDSEMAQMLGHLVRREGLTPLLAQDGAEALQLIRAGDPDVMLADMKMPGIDGMDLVVLGLGGRLVPQTRARAVLARARQKGCTLLVTDGDWQGASTRLQARVCGHEITGASVGGRAAAPAPGFGRISGVRLQVSGVCAGRRVAGRARAG